MAREMILQHKELKPRHFEADMWFDKYNNGVFEKEKLHQAHTWCEGMVKRSMLAECPLIIVANTFIKRSWMRRYLDMAEDFKYDVTTIVATGNWKSIHNVPDETMERFRKMFEA